MASCDYYVLNDIYTAIDEKLTTVAEKIDELELDINVDEIDIDLDNLEVQLRIANKLKLLEAVGTNIMSEEEQIEAYTAIKNELFVPTINTPDPMIEEEGEI